MPIPSSVMRRTTALDHFIEADLDMAGHGMLRNICKASWAILNRVIWISAGRGPVRARLEVEGHVQVLPALVDVVLRAP